MLLRPPPRPPGSQASSKLNTAIELQETPIAFGFRREHLHVTFLGFAVEFHLERRALAGNEAYPASCLPAGRRR